VAVDTRTEHDGLASLYLPIAIVVALVVVGLLVTFAIRYRARDAAAAATPAGGPTHAPRVELVYALFLVAIVAFLLWLTFRVEARIDPVASNPALTVDVTAAKWQWRFDYPREGIVQRQVGDRDPTLVVPVGEEVRFNLRAKDVIHAFWIPAMRWKRDATPGRTTVFTLAFPHVGAIPGGGLCSEFCGIGHDQMRFNVRVLSRAAFARWAALRSVNSDVAAVDRAPSEAHGLLPARGGGAR
jgi:cytochrome c oxidase subunit 2